MNCDPEKLAAHVLGELDDNARALMRAHIEGCAVCGQRARELRATLGLLRSLPDAEARPVAMDDLRAAARIEDSRRRQNTAGLSRGARRRFLRRAVALAAAVLLAAAGFRYGVAIRIGPWEVAFGGGGRTAAAPAGQTPWTEASLRSLVQEELAAQVQPALLQLAQSINELDASHQADLVALHNALLLQRENDMNEVKRTFGVFASTVNETLGIR